MVSSAATPQPSVPEPLVSDRQAFHMGIQVMELIPSSIYDFKFVDVCILSIMFSRTNFQLL